MNLKKLLSLVLIASMLLTGTALMEEESDAEVPAVVGMAISGSTGFFTMPMPP